MRWLPTLPHSVHRFFSATRLAVLLVTAAFALQLVCSATLLAQASPAGPGDPQVTPTVNGKEGAARTESRAEPSRPRPEAVRRIVVSIPDRQIALLENGHVVRVFPVAVGAFNQPTPTGAFEIVHRIPDPTYYRPGIVIPPGPANPLGSRWLGLSRKSMGIHGTNEPDSIGKSLSNGCIRMHNHDVEELFELVRAGDRVEIYSQRNTELVGIFNYTPQMPRLLLPAVVATAMKPQQ